MAVLKVLEVFSESNKGERKVGPRVMSIVREQDISVDKRLKPKDANPDCRDRWGTKPSMLVR
jgi:hypothetical protein